MPHRPEIFISATTKDLKSCRQMVRDALLTLGCVPVVQDHFAPDARTVKEMLRERIAGCDAVVHLAGECYGFEPQERAGSEPRRSYTQMEYDAARELRKPVYTFLCADGFPYDAHVPEPDELRALQREHRAALAAGDHLYVPVKDAPELEKSVRELQTRLEHVSRDLRKTRSWLAWGVAAGLAILLVIGGLFYILREHTAGVERELAEVRRQLQHQTKTDLVNEKLDRLLQASGGAKGGDPSATARAEAARQLGISVAELQKQLADEHTDLQQLLTRIDAQSAGALAQAEQWKKLKRETLTKLGDGELAAGRYAASVEPFRQALALVDEQKEPLVWCDAAQNLEVALLHMGRYPESEPLVRKVLERRTALLGPEHPDTLRSVTNLADWLYDKGNYAEAEPLYRRCLEANEKTLGPEHLRTLRSLYRLATLLNVRGDHAGAEPLYRRCLEARERTLGPDHPDTLYSLFGLANLFYAKGDNGSAEPLYRRCLEGRERTLGPDHPDTLACVNNLANLLHSKGDLAGAETLYRRCLEARELTLGPEHPQTLTSVNNLANLLHSKGDLAGAEALYRRSLAGHERTLGPEHPHTLICVYNLANTLMDKRDYAGAEALYRRCLEARERVLGREHPDTAAAAFNYALTEVRQGKLREALPLAQEAVAAARASLPEDHPDRRECEKLLRNLQAMIAATDKPGV